MGGGGGFGGGVIGDGGVGGFGGGDGGSTTTSMAETLLGSSNACKMVKPLTFREILSLLVARIGGGAAHR